MSVKGNCAIALCEYGAKPSEKFGMKGLWKAERTVKRNQNCN